MAVIYGKRALGTSQRPLDGCGDCFLSASRGHGNDASPALVSERASGHQVAKAPLPDGSRSALAAPNEDHQEVCVSES